MNLFWTVSLFWIFAVVCVVIALAFVLPALLRTRAGPDKAGRRDVNIAVYRDQMKELEADRANGMLSDAQYQSSKRELEARLADDALSQDEAPEPVRVSSRRLAYALGAVLPTAAFALYFWLGNPAALMALADGQSGPTQASLAAAPSEDVFIKLIQLAEAKTQANPDDGKAWAMLAKTHAVIEQWPNALRAFEQAIKLLPTGASVLSGYAEALAITNNLTLTGKPMALVRKALEIDPKDMKALQLAAFNANQEGNFAQASAYFKRMHSLLPPESPQAQDILAAQQEAERLANPPPADNKTASMAPGATIRGSVDIAPALKSKLKETDVLFLFARPGQSGPPVAAIRGRVGQFPLEFELNDSTAMSPGNTLSQHKQVMLVARVSKSGNPLAQPGDLEGRILDVKVGAMGVKLVIDQVLP